MEKGFSHDAVLFFLVAVVSLSLYSFTDDVNLFVRDTQNATQQLALVSSPENSGAEIPEEERSTYSRFDLDGNGKIVLYFPPRANGSDYEILVRCWLELLDGDVCEQADFTNDGTINGADAEEMSAVLKFDSNKNGEVTL